MKVLRENAVAFSSLAAFLAVFLVIDALTHQLVASLLLGMLLGAAAGLAVYSFALFDPTLEEYRLDVRRRVRNLHRAVEQIRRLGSKLHDQPSRTALEEGCNTILRLIKLVQEKDPNSVASTASRVGGYLESIAEVVLPQYLQMQAHPQDYEGSNEQMRLGRQRFAGLATFATRSIQQVTSGNMMAYRAELRLLEPLPPMPEIS